METPMIVAIVGVVILVALVAAWMLVRNKRTQDLKRQFGSEYDRALKTTGSRSRAETELLSRNKRLGRLEIHPLSPTDHDRFAESWRSTQAAFVDRPASAVSEAEKLVVEVMRARGYPVGDFDQQAADLSVGHSHFVESYREAHALALARERGQASTENLRQAMVHYRALFEDLLKARRPEFELSR
jgi:ABC-type nickel/cobalt efflux system permease component RcnA